MIRTRPARLALAIAAGAGWLAGVNGCAGKRQDLSTDQLNAVVASEQPALKRCYDAALVSSPYKEEMRMEAEIHIRPSGEVGSVKLHGGGGLPGMMGCLKTTIGGWHFPQAKDPTDTSLPLIFHPEVKAPTPNLDTLREALKGMNAK